MKLKAARSNKISFLPFWKYGTSKTNGDIGKPAL